MSIVTVYPSIRQPDAPSRPVAVVLAQGLDPSVSDGLPTAGEPIASTVDTPEQALLSLLGYAATPLDGIPGAVCRQHGRRQPTAAVWQVCADPLHIEPDGDTARSTEGAMLAIEDEDADSLIAAANALLAPDGLHLHRGSACHWYLSGGEPATQAACALAPSTLGTAPAAHVAGRPLDAYLPVAPQAAPWRRLMSEMQMLLHSHPVNDARARRGLPTINGLWFWGGAAMPERRAAPPVALYADDAFSVGAGALAGVGCDALQAMTEDALLSTSAVTETIIIVETSMSAMSAVARLAWLQQAVDAGQLSRTIVDTGDGQAIDIACRHRGWWQRLRNTVRR